MVIHEVVLGLHEAYVIELTAELQKKKMAVVGQVADDWKNAAGDIIWNPRLRYDLIKMASGQ